MKETRGGSLNPAKVSLVRLAGALPVFEFPNKSEHQLERFDAEAYGLWIEIQELVEDEKKRIPVDGNHFRDTLDALLRKVFPTATPNDLASFGANVELKMAPILAAAGQVDHVVALLQGIDEGNESTGQSTPHSGPSTTSARRSRGTVASIGKRGRKR